MNVALIIHEATIIAETLEAIDARRPGDARTLDHATPEELLQVYVSADKIRRETAAGRKKGGRS